MGCISRLIPVFYRNGCIGHRPTLKCSKTIDIHGKLMRIVDLKHSRHTNFGNKLIWESWDRFGMHGEPLFSVNFISCSKMINLWAPYWILRFSSLFYIFLTGSIRFSTSKYIYIWDLRLFDKKMACISRLNHIFIKMVIFDTGRHIIACKILMSTEIWWGRFDSSILGI